MIEHFENDNKTTVLFDPNEPPRSVTFYCDQVRFSEKQLETTWSEPAPLYFESIDILVFKIGEKVYTYKKENIS